MEPEYVAEPKSDKRSRTIEWFDPAPYVAEGMNRRPLDYLRDMMNGKIPPAPAVTLLGIEGVEIEEGHVVLALDPAEFHYNPLGVVHGGVIATLLDSTLALAVHSTLPAGGYFSTLQLNVNYIRPVTEATGRLVCDAKLRHAGKTTATAEGSVVDGRGKLIATATTTCMLFRPAEA
jgi:uncharacterized protein (TIGR00369 family)